MIYFLLWLIILFFSLFFFRKASGSLSLFKPNLVSISFYYSFLITCYIGALLIVLKIDNFYMMNKLPADEYRYIGFGIMCFVMLFFPMTMFIIGKLFGFDSKEEFNTYFSKPISPVFKTKSEFYLIFLFLSITSLLAIGYIILKTPNIPIFELVSGASSEELSRYRIEAGSNFSGNILVKNILGLALTPLLSIIAYIFSVKTNDRKWKVLFYLLFFSSIFINVYDLAKSPVIFYLFMFLLARIYVGKTKLNFTKLITIGGIGISVLLFMYIFVFDLKDIQSYLSYSSGPIGRVILSQVSPLFLHLGYFGDVIPFLNGQGLPSALLGLFDQEQVRSARLVMLQAYPENVESGIAGVLNTIYAAEAYANFGFLGVVLATVYIASIIQIMYIIFMRLPKNPIFLSLYIYFTVNIPRALVGGFTDFILNPLWMMLVGLFVGILLYIRVKKDFTSYYKNLKENRA